MRRLTVDSRLLGAGLLAALAAAVVLVMTRPPDTSAVLVVADPVAAGTDLGTVSFDQRSVADPTGLVAAAREPELAGRVAVVDLVPGTPLTDAVLDTSEATSVSDVIGLELEAAAAVHGALAAGDQVDVYLTSDPAAPLAADVKVVAVFGDDGSFATGDIGLLLAVNDTLAPVLVAAASSDSIHLVRSGS